MAVANRILVQEKQRMGTQRTRREGNGNSHDIIDTIAVDAFCRNPAVAGGTFDSANLGVRAKPDPLE